MHNVYDPRNCRFIGVCIMFGVCPLLNKYRYISYIRLVYSCQQHPFLLLQSVIMALVYYTVAKEEHTTTNFQSVHHSVDIKCLTILI